MDHGSFILSFPVGFGSLLSRNSSLYVGDKTGTDYEDQIMTFRERFEAIIKTDGEDSGSGAGFLHHAPPMQPPTTQVPPPSAHLANGHTSVMPGAYDPHGLEKKRHLSKDEKALNAAV